MKLNLKRYIALAQIRAVKAFHERRRDSVEYKMK